MAMCLRIVALIALLTVFHTQAAIKIVISHCNDFSAQFQSFRLGTHLSSKAPEPCIRNQEKCVGGFPGIVHWMNENRTSGYDFSKFPSSNILRLSSGNLIGGENGWISSMEKEGWTKYGVLVGRYINPSALSLGMKEFGAGIPQTVNFMNGVYLTWVDSSFPVTPKSRFTLVNTCGTSHTELEHDFCKLLEFPIKRIEVLDDASNIIHPIGIIGFITPNVEVKVLIIFAQRMSIPGSLGFTDIVSHLKKVTAFSDILTYIAIGDGSLEIARSIIDQVPKVKLVIYGAGFDNTLNMSDNYPLKHNNGFIATAGRYGSSVGKMVLQINKETGDITVLNSELQVTSHPKKWTDIATRAMSDIVQWEAQIYQRKTEVIGQTRVSLEGGEKCWRKECNLGNLMADAAVHCVFKRIATTAAKYSYFQPIDTFRFPLHSVWHAGAFSSEHIIGFENVENIRKFDIYKFLPYQTKVHLVKVKGADLRAIFEASASGINPSAEDWGQFLQVSNGLEVYYDNTTKVPTVTKIRIQHDVNRVPELGDLQNDNDYYLVIPTYLYEGRGLYKFARSMWKDVDVMDINFGLDADCLQEYIQSLTYVTVGLEERILIKNRDDVDDDWWKTSGPDDNHFLSNGTAWGVTVVLICSTLIGILAFVFVKLKTYATSYSVTV